MLRLVFLTMFALVLSTTVQAQSIPERTGVNSALGISPSTQDFVTQAAISDLFEVESSKLAQQKADDKSKAFAGKMIQDHTQTSKELKSLVDGGSIKATLPTALDKTHQDKLAKLQSLSGADFDKEYDSAQLSGHKDAVSLFERYAKGGENTELKAFAAKHLPHLQEHLRMAEELRK